MKSPWRIAIATQYWVDNDRHIIRGVVDYGAAHQCFQFRDVRWTSEDLPQRLARLNCDGAILNLMSVDFDLMHGFPEIPMVNIGNEVLRADIPSVATRPGEAFRILLRHLRQQGYRRFAYMGYQPADDSNSLATRLRGMLEPAEGPLALGSFPDLRQEETYEECHASGEVTRWLAEFTSQPGPVGVITYGGIYSSALIAACQELGLDIPRDVGIASCVDELKCITIQPAITSAEPPGYEFGHNAMQLLHRMLAGEEIPGQLFEVGQGTLVARGSTLPSKAGQDGLDIALEFIHENFERDIGIGDILRHVGTISRARFFDSFTRRAGMPPAEYLRSLRLKRAKELLIGTPLTMVRIAKMCGYSSQSQFASSFRRQVGQSPTEYRESNTAGGKRRKAASRK